MERKFYDSDFERLIKEKADQYKMYPSDRVWKSIDRALHSRRRWYWSGFVLLLSGISYLAITELMAPSSVAPVQKSAATEQKKQVTTQQLIPFTSPAYIEPLSTPGDEVTSDFTFEDNGNLTAAIQIPLQLIPGASSSSEGEKASVFISGLEPLKNSEQYNIELSWPVAGENHIAPGTNPTNTASISNSSGQILTGDFLNIEEKARNKWLLDNAPVTVRPVKTNGISWQLAFSPTINYRKLTGSKNMRYLSAASNIPLAIRIEGDVDELVNHKPALGFELGTHGMLKLNNRVTFKGGIQFNYSKYDIRAFKAPRELATIALNSQTGNSTIVSYTDLRNFGGSSVEDLKNQYFQLSLPVGFEFRVFGGDRLQFNLASTLQPTYLLNSNTYLITTDFKNYAKEPSLVRKWNVNAGAEAFIAYERGGVKWQVGPQFRYQLLSSYQKEYPIKEYLMEYGIKVGITKTIR
jgi:hypothetical protein